MNVIGISLHSQVQLRQYIFPIKLTTFPTYTKNFRKIKIKLTQGDHDQNYKAQNRPLRALGVKGIANGHTKGAQ